MTTTGRVRERVRPVAVVGAGFSGTIAAAQLLAALPAPRGVLLCERAERFGRGLAYATGQPDHLLNVRAANMSAFASRPAHFTDWLERCGDPSGTVADRAGLFARRGLYGRYLADLLAQALAPPQGAPRLALVNDAVTDLEPDGEGFRLRTEGGRAYPVAGAVVALGNLRPPRASDGLSFPDPWDPAALEGLVPDLPVLVVGTGLTMVDTALALSRCGLAAPIVALSRRGLLPQAHAASQARPLPGLAQAAATPRALLRRVRAEVAGAAAGDWRAVVDGLRPATQAIWQGWPPSERRRFLRHLRPYWDVHRHRMAPPVAQTLDRLRAQGRLVVRPGRLVGLAPRGEGRALATLRPRGGRADTELEVQRVIEARGTADAAGAGDALVGALLRRGLARLDPLGIGLDARDDLALLSGQAGTGRLWGLGPIVRGVFWECTAVPDIRTQAAALATVVAGSLAAPV